MPGFTSFTQPFSKEIADLINGLRISEGLSYLTYDENLEKMAVYYCDLLVDAGQQVSHDLLTDNEWANVAYKHVIDYIAIELLVQSPTPVPHAYTCYRGLYNSPRHKEGMLSKYGTNIGIAYSSAASRSYVTVYIGEEPKKRKRISSYAGKGEC